MLASNTISREEQVLRRFGIAQALVVFAPMCWLAGNAYLQFWNPYGYDYFWYNLSGAFVPVFIIYTVYFQRVNKLFWFEIFGIEGVKTALAAVLWTGLNSLGNDVFRSALSTLIFLFLFCVPCGYAYSVWLQKRGTEKEPLLGHGSRQEASRQ